MLIVPAALSNTVALPRGAQSGPGFEPPGLLFFARRSFGEVNQARPTELYYWAKAYKRIALWRESIRRSTEAV